jgi:hypothetical protein
MEVQHIRAWLHHRSVAEKVTLIDELDMPVALA